MHSTLKKRRRKNMVRALFVACAFGLIISNVGVSYAKGKESGLDRKVMATLQHCQQVSSSCADMTKNSVGILVFPTVTTADLIIGGSGGKGAVIENGKITGYYNISAGSAGLQAGIENASQVYVFNTPEGLSKLKSGPDWKVGATAGVTAVDTATNTSGVTGDVLAYVFNSSGLNAGVSLDMFDVWKSGKERPSQS